MWKSKEARNEYERKRREDPEVNARQRAYPHPQPPHNQPPHTARMSSVRKTVIEVLQNRGSMSLGALSKELVRSGVLGFGVETNDVVSALAGEGKVSLKEDEVSLVEHSR
jgi:hypothetical protein